MRFAQKSQRKRKNQMPEIKIIQTNYPHPSITSGVHTNGAAKCWISVDGEWFYSGSSSLRKVRKEIEKHGVDRIVAGEDWQCPA